MTNTQTITKKRPTSREVCFGTYTWPRKECPDAEKLGCPYKKKCRAYTGKSIEEEKSYPEEVNPYSIASLLSPKDLYLSLKDLNPGSRVWIMTANDGEQGLIVCNPGYMQKQSFFDKENENSMSRLRKIVSNATQKMEEKIFKKEKD